MDGMAILTDPYSKTEYELWYSTPDCVAESMILQPGADLTVFTHNHTDHFNLDFTLRMLRQHPEMHVISGENVSHLFQKTIPAETDILSRITAACPEKSSSVIRQGPVTITMIPTVHDSENLYATEHYAVFIRGSRKILILGDTKPSSDNFAFLQNIETPDLVLAPFTYLTLRNGRRIVFDLIKPSKAAFLHFPVKSGDGLFFREAAVKSAERLSKEGKDIKLLTESGFSFLI